MLGILARAALTLSVVMALSSCGGSAETSSSASGDDSSGEKISVAGSSALRWGHGDYGVVLAHGAAFDAASWEEQAVAIADQGATVIAVENIGPAAIRDAVKQLQGEGVADVALVGGSAGADAILDLVSQEPGLADQLILLSPNATVDGLGDEPKLFVASEDEPVAHAQNIFATDLAGSVLEAMLERLKRFATQ